MQYIIKINNSTSSTSSECYVCDLHYRTTTKRTYHAKRFQSIEDAQNELDIYAKRHKNWKPSVGSSSIYDVSLCEIIQLTERDLEREKINNQRIKERKTNPKNIREVKYIVKVKKGDSSNNYFLVGWITPEDKDIIVTTNPEEALTFESALNLYYHFNNFNFEFEIVLQEFPNNWIDFDLILDDEELNEQKDEDSTDYEKEIMRALRNGDGDLLGL